MNIIEEIHDRTALLEKLLAQASDTSKAYLYDPILFALKCYLVAINREEFQALLLNASLTSPDLSYAEIPTMGEILEQIKTVPDFLEQNRQYVGLNTQRVKDCIQSFTPDYKPENCLVVDLYDGMTPDQNYFILDGMHRLVAYGIWTKLDAEKFPIQVYLCTNHVLDNA
jgi:hypothetical protein